MERHYITWWNVENLFDIENSSVRPSWLKSRLRGELNGWTAAVLKKKLTQLASVISQINGGAGPDVLGVCEVENEAVMQKLMTALSGLGRNYAVLHSDTDDGRGIDIAFIYDQDKYESAKDENGKDLLFKYEVLKRNATRDIVQVSLKTKQGRDIILIGNHWPARLGGQYFSEPYRIIAAETLSYWLERIQEILGKDAAVLVMGDFNDEPHNRSLTQYALSSNSKHRVVYSRSPILYNLMWEPLGHHIASYVNNNEPCMLDQFLVSKGLVKSTSPIKVMEGTTKVEIFEGMAAGRYSYPRRFGRPSSNYDENGYSDHFPISVEIQEKS